MSTDMIDLIQYILVIRFYNDVGPTDSGYGPPPHPPLGWSFFELAHGAGGVWDFHIATHLVFLKDFPVPGTVTFSSDINEDFLSLLKSESD